MVGDGAREKGRGRVEGNFICHAKEFELNLVSEWEPLNNLIRGLPDVLMHLFG